MLLEEDLIFLLYPDSLKLKNLKKMLSISLYYLLILGPGVA